MKSFTILTVVSMLTTSFSNNVSVTNSLEETGSHVISALKHASVEEYNSMLPTLTEFYEIMDYNKGVYGTNLAEAKKEFANRYESKILPALTASFKAVIEEGYERGINWENIQLVRIKNQGPSAENTPVDLEITFTDGDKEYRIKIGNAFVWQGTWRVTQFIELS